MKTIEKLRQLRNEMFPERAELKEGCEILTAMGDTETVTDPSNKFYKTAYLRKLRHYYDKIHQRLYITSYYFHTF